MSYFSLPYILLYVVVLFVIWLIAAYNGLVRRRNRVDEAWSDIDVQLKRRYDLIPNLVETVKGYAAHEKQVFENVTQARAAAMGAQGLAEKDKAENALSQTLKSVFAVAENYPQLKASENFLELQRELTDTEDKIQASRRFYNGTVLDFNTSLQTFPRNTIAGMFGFARKEFFGVAEQAEREPVKVKF
jgi:LemA protein